MKLLLIGNLSVGKSSLLQCFSEEQLLPGDETKTKTIVGVDSRVSKVKVNSPKVKLRSLYRYVIQCFSYSVTTLLVQLMVHWLKQGRNGTVSYNDFCLLLWSLNHHLRHIRKSLKLFKLSNKNRLSHIPIAYDITNRKTFNSLP